MFRSNLSSSGITALDRASLYLLYQDLYPHGKDRQRKLVAEPSCFELVADYSKSDFQLDFEFVGRFDFDLDTVAKFEMPADALNYLRYRSAFSKSGNVSRNILSC